MRIESVICAFLREGYRLIDEFNEVIDTQLVRLFFLKSYVRQVWNVSVNGRPKKLFVRSNDRIAIRTKSGEPISKRSVPNA